jgi:ubiquinone/menaquinone biosynthesis C-methylase UbiE
VNGCGATHHSLGPRSASAQRSRRPLYDAAAPAFESHRALPQDVAEALRAAVLHAIGKGVHTRLLDLGAGTGRTGRAFVAAGDDYLGIDLSLGMLCEFARHTGEGPAPPLVQADGRALPFADATFDGVMLIQVFGGLDDWPALLAEARRVLRNNGALMLGRTVAPEDGIDAPMKRHLAGLLEEQGFPRKQANVRKEVERWLEERAANESRAIAASWLVQRTPRAFLERHRTGARFSALPETVKDGALARLGAWAVQHFGSLDSRFEERHEFELRVFRF